MLVMRRSPIDPGGRPRRWSCAARRGCSWCAPAAMASGMIATPMPPMRICISAAAFVRGALEDLLEGQHLDQQRHQRTDDDADRDDRQQRRELDVLQDQVGGERREHEDRAVGEVQDVDRPPRQAHAQGEQQVDRAQADDGHDFLHGLLQSCRCWFRSCRANGCGGSRRWSRPTAHQWWVPVRVTRRCLRRGASRPRCRSTRSSTPGTSIGLLLKVRPSPSAPSNGSRPPRSPCASLIDVAVGGAGLLDAPGRGTRPRRRPRRRSSAGPRRTRPL